MRVRAIKLLLEPREMARAVPGAWHAELCGHELHARDRDQADHIASNVYAPYAALGPLHVHGLNDSVSRAHSLSATCSFPLHVRCVTTLAWPKFERWTRGCPSVLSARDPLNK